MLFEGFEVLNSFQKTSLWNPLACSWLRLNFCNLRMNMLELMCLLKMNEFQVWFRGFVSSVRFRIVLGSWWFCRLSVRKLWDWRTYTFNTTSSGGVLNESGGSVHQEAWRGCLVKLLKNLQNAMGLQAVALCCFFAFLHTAPFIRCLPCYPAKLAKATSPVSSFQRFFTQETSQRKRCSVPWLACALRTIRLGTRTHLGTRPLDCGEFTF